MDMISISTITPYAITQHCNMQGIIGKNTVVFTDVMALENRNYRITDWPCDVRNRRETVEDMWNGKRTNKVLKEKRGGELKLAAGSNW